MNDTSRKDTSFSPLANPMPYTHGLESVYAFETIDPLSVRKLQPSLSRHAVPQQDSVDSTVGLSVERVQTQNQQFQLDNIFGKIENQTSSSLQFAPFQPFPNLRFFEPIEALELSSFLTSKIRQKKIFLIEELDAYLHEEIRQHKTYSSPMDSMERSHLSSPQFKRDRLSLSQIEEISAKIKQHTFGGKKKVPFIEWNLLSSLLFINLNSPQEEDEALFLFSLEECSHYCQRLFRSSKERLPLEEKKKLKLKIKDFLRLIFFSWVAPWISAQEGIIHSYELENYLDELSSESFLMQDSNNSFFSEKKSSEISLRDFIAWVYGEKFLFSSYLIPCKDGHDELYAWGHKAAQEATHLITAIQNCISLLQEQEIPSCITSSSIVHTVQRDLMRNWGRLPSAQRIKELAFFLT